MQETDSRLMQQVGQHDAVARNVGHLGGNRARLMVQVRQQTAVFQSFQIFLLTAEIRMRGEGKGMPGHLPVFNQRIQLLLQFGRTVLNDVQKRPGRHGPDIPQLSHIPGLFTGLYHLFQHPFRVIVDHP